MVQLSTPYTYTISSNFQQPKMSMSGIARVSVLTTAVLENAVQSAISAT